MRKKDRSRNIQRAKRKKGSQRERRTPWALKVMLNYSCNALGYH